MKIKSLIARTIKNLGKLTAFNCLLLPAFAICCLLGSWTNNNGIYESDYLKKNTTYFGNGTYVTKNSETSNDYYNTLNLTWDFTEIEDAKITTNILNLSNANYIMIEEQSNIIGNNGLIIEIISTQNATYTYTSDLNTYDSFDYKYNNLNGYTFLLQNNVNISTISLRYSRDYLAHEDSIPNSDTISYKITFTTNEPYITMFRDTNLIQADTYKDVQSWYYDNGTEEFISKNIWNPENFTLEIGTIDNDGTNLNSNARLRTKNKNYIISGTYSISFEGLEEFGYALYSFENDTNSYYSTNWINKENPNHTFTIQNDTYIRFKFKYANDRTINNINEIYNIMLVQGNLVLPYLPYGIIYSEEQYNNLEEDYVYYQNQYNIEKNRADEYENLYNNLLGTKTIDYDNYKIYYVNYGTAQTTENYTIIGEVNVRDYVSPQGFLDISDIRTITGFGDTWDGIVVESVNYLNVYNYNLLFNGSGSANLDFALYYKYFDTDAFSVLSLSNIVGDSAYYGYFDLISLFGRNNIATNFQNMLYNKFAIHWTGIPSDTDLVNIKLNSADGYNSGYAQGQADQLYNLEELNETIENKDRQLQELQNQYDNLLDHYNNAQIDNPLSQMVVSIADIPLNLFHEMFDFNILGFNLSAFILGIITILLVAYVIKLFL